MTNIFYIKGKEIKHSMYFGSCKGKEIELVVVLSDFEQQHFVERNVAKSGVRVTPSVDVNSGELTLYTTFVLVSEYRVATEKEIELFNTKLAEKNLVYETRKYKKLYFPFDRAKYMNEEDFATTYYKDKDNFRIVLGDKVVTYKELKETQFADDDKIVLSGDNGYSHCWASTIKANDVFKFIEVLFAVPTLETTRIDSCRQSVAFCNELWGYNFNQYGELVLRVTKENVQYSEVSFS